MELLQNVIKKAVKKVYGEDLEKAFVEHPENPQWGDFATNVAFELSGKLKQKPSDIAKKICYEINDKMPDFKTDDGKYPLFEKVEYADPGFINFKLSSAWLQNVLFQAAAHFDAYRVSDTGLKKKIALEHSNVNPNKATHIGHLRNACLGQFIERVYEHLGYNVEVQYYNNDLGVQVVTSYLGSTFFGDISPDKYSKYDHYAWDVYARMEAAISSDDKLRQMRDEFMMKVETDQDEQQKLKEFALKVLKEQLKTFRHLGFDYDVVINESDIVALKFWERAFEMLKKNHKVYMATEGKSKDCWLIKLSQTSPSAKSSDEFEEDKVLVRSNGVPTYTARDIAYHMWKFGLLGSDFSYEIWDTGSQQKPLWITTLKPGRKTTGSFSNADFVFDVIDVRQTYAIDAVKKSLEYLGYEKQAENMTHINYGFVYLSRTTAEKLGMDVSDGKEFYAMSGRKGWGIKVDDFITLVDKKLSDEFGESTSLQEVRNSAIKFEMLKSNTFQDLVFDLDLALNIKGYTGPYLLYAYARCFSLLEKSGLSLDDIEKPDEEYKTHEKESAIMRKLYLYREVLYQSAVEFAPNMLCNYLYELSQAFNSLYAELPILTNVDDKTKNYRLMLTLGVSNVLRHGLFILGMQVVNKI